MHNAIEKPKRSISSYPVSFIKHIPLLIWSFVILAPLVILVLISFKTNKDYAMSLPIALPTSWSFKNYTRVLIEGRLLHALKNSMILVVIGSCGSALLGAMTAFCLQRFNFFLKKYILFAYLGSAMIPSALLQIMIYKLMKTLNLTGTWGAPMLIYISTDIIQVWIYLQFMENIPVSLDESAMLDGASYFKIFRSIIMPLLLPATSTVLIIKSIFIYNDMFTQYLFMSSTKLQTATTALMAYSGQFATSFNVMAAGCVTVMLPTLIIFLALQKYIFSGITSGAVKG